MLAKYWSENHEGRHHLAELCVDGKVILVLQWTGFQWLKILSIDWVLCKCLIPIKGGSGC
jgi:hypothetical protein